MTDFEDMSDGLPPSADVEAEKHAHEQTASAIRLIAAVKDGQLDAVPLDSVLGPEWADITVTRQNTDLATDMVQAHFSERFPDLFEPPEEQAERP